MKITKYLTDYLGKCNQVVNTIEGRVNDLDKTTKDMERMAQGVRQVRDGLYAMCNAAPLCHSDFERTAGAIMEDVEKMANSIMEVSFYMAYYDTPPDVVLRAIQAVKDTADAKTSGKDKPLTTKFDDEDYKAYLSRMASEPLPTKTTTRRKRNGAV